MRDAIRAGAIGFTTSRSPAHETPDGRPVASRLATWDEVRRLVGVMGDLNAGHLRDRRRRRRPRRRTIRGCATYHARLRDLAVETGRPITFGVFSRRGVPDVWRKYLALLDETAAAGGRMFAQVHSRSLSALLSFKTQMPFDRLPGVEGAARAAARRAAPDVCTIPSCAASSSRPPASATAGAPVGAEARAGRLRLAPRLRHRRRAAPHGGRGRARARPASGRDHDRSRPGQGPRPVLPAADRQRGPGLRARADAPPARRRHVLRLGRARVAAHGLVAADAPALPLGAAQAGRSPSSRPCACSTLVPATLWGFADRGLVREGHGGRPRRLRSRDDRRGDAGSRGRSARPARAASCSARAASRRRSSTARSCCATASTPGRCRVSFCGASRADVVSDPQPERC
mgnify:CR=1 FL=1